jgi:hypothetical protein
MMPRWPDEAVLSFPRPWPMAKLGLVRPADWVRIVVEADWLFRHGMDTVDIAAALGLREGDALRAVSQGREARIHPNEGASNATALRSTAEVIPCSRGVAGSTGEDRHHEEGCD